MTAPYEPPRTDGPHPADRLAEIKAQRQAYPMFPNPKDLDWLIGEVEWLRGRLAELEWAGP